MNSNAVPSLLGCHSSTRSGQSSPSDLPDLGVVFAHSQHPPPLRCCAVERLRLAAAPEQRLCSLRQVVDFAVPYVSDVSTAQDRAFRDGDAAQGADRGKVVHGAIAAYGGRENWTSFDHRMPT